MSPSEGVDYPRHGALRVADLGAKGRGVIATGAIADGELLEVAPVIPLKPGDQPAKGTILYDYPFLWDDPPYVEAIALGVVSMINHSGEPNAWFEVDIPNKLVRVHAIRAIAAGEEVTFDYRIPLWFDAAE